MSLPSVVVHFDKAGNEIHREGVNIGWFVDEDSWVRCIHEQVYYVQGSQIVLLYGIKFALKWKHPKYESLLRQLFQERQAAYKIKNNLDGYRDYLILTRSATVKKSHDEYTKVMLPMIRKIVPNLIASELAGVQPMTENAGLIWSLRDRYFRKSWYERLWDYIYKVLTQGDDYHLWRALSQIKRLREREENFKSPEDLQNDWKTVANTLKDLLRK
jgi:hypothetical protein